MQRIPDPTKVQQAATRTEARRLTPSNQAEGRKRKGKARQPNSVNRVRVDGSQAYTYSRFKLMVVRFRLLF